MYEDFIGNFPEDQASPLEEKKQGNREAAVSADYYSLANVRSVWIQTFNSDGCKWNKYKNMHTILLSALFCSICVRTMWLTREMKKNYYLYIYFVHVRKTFKHCNNRKTAVSLEILKNQQNA